MILHYRWQWHKFKDMFHYYLMVGLIPVGAIIFYTNVFIGPAQLTPIPEGYEPKHWEYHRHPITRFIARYIHSSPQQVNIYYIILKPLNNIIVCEIAYYMMLLFLYVEIT